MASAAVGPERNEKRTRRFSPGFSGVGPTSTRQSQPWREPRRAMQGHLFPVRMGVCRPRLRFGTDEGRPRGRTASDNESLEQAGAPIPLEGAAPGSLYPPMLSRRRRGEQRARSGRLGILGAGAGPSPTGPHPRRWCLARKTNTAPENGSSAKYPRTSPARPSVPWRKSAGLVATKHDLPRPGAPSRIERII